MAAFFAVLAVLGVGIHRDFGLTWDEVGIHEYGDLLFDHYPPGGAWEDYSNLRYYGPVVALLTAGVRRLSSSPEAAYPLAHLLYFALFLGGVYAFYKLCARQFAGWGWGLFGATLLVASPRVFSHAFVNPKDTPLMAAFIVAMYLLTRFLDTRGPKWMALCGVATAVAIDIRVAGVFLVVLVVGSVLADALRRPPGPGSESAGSHGSRDTLVAFAATAAPLTVLLWPYLWPNPVARLLDTLQIMAFFDTGPQHTLYRGEMVSIRDTPWLDHLLSTTSGPVKIHACFAPGPAVDNARLFADGDRLLYVPLEEAGYAICTPRAGTPIPYLPEHPTVYRVRRDGATILYVKRLTPVPTGSAAGVPGA